MRLSVSRIATAAAALFFLCFLYIFICFIFISAYFYLHFFLSFFLPSAAVAALLRSPLVTSNAGVAEAACGAVTNLAAGNAENKAKLGAACVCEGGYPLDASLAFGLGRVACLSVRLHVSIIAAAASAWLCVCL